MPTTKLIAISGSTRTGSYNSALLRLAVRTAADAGADVTLLSAQDMDLPIYNGDLEARDGLPAKVLQLQALFASSAGFLIASPENNACVSALLKNTLDWVSRGVPASQGGPSSVSPYKGKTAALLAASPGALGGLRGLVALRAIMQTLGVLVLTEQHALSLAHQAFDEAGELKDPRQAAAMTAVVQRLVSIASRLG